MLKKLILPLCACLMLFGCGAQPEASAPAEPAGGEPNTRQIFAMDTIMDLSVYGGDEALLDQAEARVQGLEQSLSTTDSSSEIYALNEKGTAELSQETADLLRQSLTLCQETGGALDVSIYPVVRAWGFTTGSYQVPSEAELSALLPHVDHSKIQVEGQNATLPQGMEIDLGGVAKGYTGDCLKELFQEAGITSALLNLGGNVQALGSKPDGSDWRVGVQDPNGGDYLGVLTMSDQAVITSGGYERYFEENGETYWHIIDPATGHPAKNGLISATAVGDKGIYCDALSTSLFVMGPEKAEAFWREHRDFDMILVTEDGEVCITPALADRFTLMPDGPYTLRVLEE